MARVLRRNAKSLGHSLAGLAISVSIFAAAASLGYATSRMAFKPATAAGEVLEALPAALASARPIKAAHAAEDVAPVQLSALPLGARQALPFQPAGRQAATPSGSRSSQAAAGLYLRSAPLYRPGQVTREASAGHLIKTLLSAPAAKPTGPRTAERRLTVRKGNTFMALLRGAGVDIGEAQAAAAALRPIVDPRQLSVGQELRILLRDASARDGGRLAGLILQADVERDVWLERDPGGTFTARTVERPLQTEVVRAASTIDFSLFGAARANNVPIPVLKEMITALSYEVDLQRELHPGDEYEVLYERIEDEDGRLARTGQLLFAALTLRDRKLAIYRFEREDGMAEYYTPDGESVRKALLRTPIDGARITSKYGMRKHPILGYSKMHQGLDFAAPRGTPIFAAGDGVIARVGRFSGYGNYVEIRHNGQYSTAYAHASGFARGLHNGSKVKQGQVIAYVGSTGRSTGPHLHYEVIANGRRIDPLSVKLVGGKLAGKELKAFKAAMAQVDRMLQNAREPLLVAERSDCGEDQPCEDEQ